MIPTQANLCYLNALGTIELELIITVHAIDKYVQKGRITPGRLSKTCSIGRKSERVKSKSEEAALT